MRLWVWVLGSRFVVLAAGAAGSLFSLPVAGWTRYDPGRVTTSLGSVGDLLAASSVRWDALGYISLAQHGYTSASSTRLFPLFPLMIRGVSMFVGSPVVAGEIIGLAAFGVGLTLVHRIAIEYVGRSAADAAVLLIAFSPLSFVFSALYTASLLLALVAASFYLAEHNRFGWACVAAAGAAVTHVQGILMVAPLAFMYWDSHGRTLNPRRLWSPSLLALALPLLTLGAFFADMHARGWGWLAPIVNQNRINAGRTLVGPVSTLINTVGDSVTGISRTLSGKPVISAGGLPPGIENIIYAIALTIAVLSLVCAWRRLPTPYVLFTALAILLCTSSSVAMEPLKGFDRYMLPIFPLWIGAGAWMQERRLTGAILMTSTILLVVYTFEFARWVSVF
jgi:hypothetical protein